MTQPQPFHLSALQRRLLVACLMGCLFVGIGASANAQLSAFLRNDYPVQGTNIQVEANGSGTCFVRALDGSTPIALKTSDIYFIENNRVSRPFQVDPAVNGYQRVLWYSKLNGQADVNDTTISVIVSNAQYSVNLKGRCYHPALATIVFQDSIGKRLERNIVDYGDVVTGQSYTYALKLYGTSGATGSTGQEERIQVDSIKTTSNMFSIRWRDAYGPFISGPPPCRIYASVGYNFYLDFTPTQSGAIVDVLTVYYGGNRRTTIRVQANAPVFPRIPTMKILSPNGGEAFAPCQHVLVRWTGAVRGSSFTIYASYNNGRSYEEIGRTNDTTFDWRVPSILSDSIRLRVRQNFTSSVKVDVTSDPSSPATNVAFRPDGAKLLLAYGTGTIYEWNTLPYTNERSYTVPLDPRDFVRGLAYINNNGDFLALTASGIVHRFTAGTPTPVQSVTLPSSFVPRDLAISTDGTKLYVTPTIAPSIFVYSLPNLTPLAPISLPSPMSAASLGSGVLLAYTLDATVYTLDLATGGITSTTPTGFIGQETIPVVDLVSASRDGRFVALGGRPEIGTTIGGNSQETFVYDLSTQTVARRIQVASSAPVALAFSSNGLNLLMAFRATTGILSWDLMKNGLDTAFGNFPGLVTDLEIRNDGKMLAYASDNRFGQNAEARDFIQADDDTTDAPFRIVAPAVVFTPVKLRTLLIGTELDTVLTSDVCNVGVVPYIINLATMKRGWYVRPADTLQGDTIQPGTCMQLRFFAAPLDTGLIEDTLFMEACDVTSTLAISFRSIDRNIPMLGDPTDFGDVCIGLRKKQTIQLLRNADTVDLLVNSVFIDRGLQSQFRVLTAIKDTIIPPNGTLSVEVEFVPRRNGLDTGHVMVRYEDQDVVKRSTRVTGRGSGADIRQSHTALPFIPEIPERTLMLTNTSENPVTITDALITAGAPFEVLTPLPYTLNSNDSVAIRIRYLGTPPTADASIEFSIQPCASLVRCALMLYSGTSVLSVANTSADPRENAILTINAQINETVPYRGVRPLRAAFTLNPRLFLGATITATNGTASIVSQDIINDRRVIVFELSSDFSGNGAIATLEGPAGLAEIDSTHMVFDPARENFGSTVTCTYATGVLTILQPDPTRRILRKTPPIIRSVDPNPASNVVTLRTRTTQALQASISVVDQQGNERLTPIPTSLPSGDSSVPINVQDLPPGVYMILVRTVDLVESTMLIVVR